jgi:hypothetical protein
MLKKLIPLLIFVLALAACTGEATPIQIASYPGGEQTQYYQSSPPSGIPPNAIIVYNASLDLTVWDIENAVKNAIQIASDYGGYIFSSNTRSDKEPYASLTFALPASNYSLALSAFKHLGTVTSESVSGKLYSSYRGQSGWDYTSYITLRLTPRVGPIHWPSLNLYNARPIRTLSVAFAVLVNILGFLLDIAIWLIVLFGPFVLVGWGVRRVLKERTPRQDPKGFHSDLGNHQSRHQVREPD